MCRSSCLDGRAVKPLDDLSIKTGCRATGTGTGPNTRSAIPRPDLRRRPGLPAAGRAAAGRSSTPPSWASRGAGATSAPRSRRSSATAAEEFKADPGLWASLLHPEDREQALAQENRGDPRRPQDAPGRVPDVHPRRRRSSGCSTRRCWKPTRTASPSGTASSTTSPSARAPRRSCSGPLAQQAVVARLGERALQDGDPEALMRAATVADRRSRRRPTAPASGSSAATAGDCTCAPASRTRRSAPAAASPPPATPTPAPRSTPALHAIVDDWSSESRFSMPPVLRVFGAASSLAVVIDGKDRPFGVLDVHADRAQPLHAPRTSPSSRRPPTCSPTRSSATPPTRPCATASCTTRSPACRTGSASSTRLATSLQAGRRLRLAGRDPLPRPRPLQADQRQPRPPRRRRPAAGRRAAPARPPAPRRHRRPLRRRRVRDPDRPPRRRRGGGRDRRPRRRRLRPALLDRRRRALRHRQHRDRRRPSRRPARRPAPSC